MFQRGSCVVVAVLVAACGGESTQGADGATGAGAGPPAKHEKSYHCYDSGNAFLGKITGTDDGEKMSAPLTSGSIDSASFDAAYYTCDESTGKAIGGAVSGALFQGTASDDITDNAYWWNSVSLGPAVKGYS